MSKITYENKVALNQNPNIPDINKVNDTDMNMIKNVVNNNETKVLLAVSSSAPATCDTGDIYFNTTDNLIYTAIATNTWGTTGVAPTENTIYIEFTSQTAYAYDGTTLVSVGGGSGSEIVVGDEEPTEDTKMIIDTDAFDPQYSDITDEYSEANNKAYSCNYVNGTVLYNNTTGSNNTITLSDSVSNYKSIEITYKCNTYGYKTMKIDAPNGKTIILDYNVVANENINQFAGSTFRAINNQLIYNNSCMLNVTLAGAITTQQDVKLITIVKVVGYNKVGE